LDSDFSILEISPGMFLPPENTLTDGFCSMSAPAPLVNLDTQSLASALNPPQFEAVTHSPGPQLILAGAGSGKTRVLTFKIAWLIREMGLRPWEVLAVTFTNKAAQEMRLRIANLIGYSANLRWVGTFHSICARLLRFHATRLGFTSNFTIYDTDDQKRFVKKLLKAENLDENVQFTDDAVRAYISRRKNLGQSPQEAKLKAEDRYEEKMAHLYFRYQEDLQKNNGMDFDDLINMAIRLLESFPEVREVFASGFRYILIDEYQDTNKAQYKLIRLLVGAHHNLVVVGDDDQSIYGWRGADIGNILSFKKDFPQARITKLEQNYRSSGNILGVASSVIRNNTKRMEKTIWTSNELGEKVTLLELDDEILEAAWVSRRIRDDIKFKPGETAIFYRTNSQSRVLEDELRRNRIPYLIVGGIRFYERKEVKDLLAYLRVLSNPLDSVALARIVNVPKRGLGDKSVQAISEMAADKNIPLMEAMRHCDQAGVSGGTARKIKEFVGLLDTLRVLVQSEPLPSVIAEIIARTGYRDFLEEEGSDESLDRLANIEELVAAAQDFIRRRTQGEGAEDANNDSTSGASGSIHRAPMGSAAEVNRALTLDLDFLSGEISQPDKNSLKNLASESKSSTETLTEKEMSSRAEDLDLFLQEISLVSDQDGLKANQEAVTLMTVHSAKGLEFPRVFVTGLEDGLFPMLRQGNDGDVEEERRLFYVAVTRARQELSLTYARRRRRYGTYQEAGGSRFFSEIDRKYLQIARSGVPQSPFAKSYQRDDGFGSRSPMDFGGRLGSGGAGPGPGGFGDRGSVEFGVEKTPEYEDFSQETEFTVSFSKGQRVKHGKFGMGTVVGMDGQGESARVHVMFGDHIRRVLMVKFAKLQVIG
jgi:DNA helicase II / ATP-dependent DNA helicase PcrA